jgi:hypothetical protein
MTRGLFSTLFLSDLDNTLFQSRWVDNTGVHPMSRTVTGDAQGYATAAQAELWDAMRNEAFCIGVSARDLEQVNRVDGWNPIHEHQLMLVDHGLTLLYRNTFKDEQWTPIEGWSAPYMALAKENARLLEKEGARLSFALMQEMPELVTVHQSKLVYTNFAVQDKPRAFYSIRARAFYGESISTHQMQPLNHLRALLHHHVSTSQLPLTYFETDGTFSLLPGWFSKKAAVQRLLALIKEPEPGLDDPRLNAAIRAIGRPKLILTAGDGFDDVEFMGLGHFMLTPTKSAITNSLLEKQSEIPLLNDVVTA